MTWVSYKEVPYMFGQGYGSTTLSRLQIMMRSPYLPLISSILFFLLVCFICSQSLLSKIKIIVRKMIKFCCFIAKASCQFLNVFPIGYSGLKADYFNFYLLPQSQQGTFGCLYSVATSLLPTYFGLVMVFVGLNGVCVTCIKEEKLVNSLILNLILVPPFHYQYCSILVLDKVT